MRFLTHHTIAPPDRGRTFQASSVRRKSLHCQMEFLGWIHEDLVFGLIGLCYTPSMIDFRETIEPTDRVSKTGINVAVHADGKQRREQLDDNDGVHIEFTWQIEPQTWCGFTKQELSELINEAAEFFDISPESKRKIFFHFGDHESFVRHSDQQNITPLIMEMGKDDPDTRDVLQCDVVVNRSLELAMEETGLTQDDIDADRNAMDGSWAISQGIMYYLVEEPWEFAVRTIAEELNHAGVDLKLKNRVKIAQSRTKYDEYVSKFISMSDENERPDSFDLHEVTASREALRFLERIAIRRGSPKALVYKELYKESLQRKMAVRFVASGILDSIFIKTGYTAEETS